MDIAFLIIGCVQSKKGRGRGFWIAALCIDIVVGLGTLFSNYAEIHPSILEALFAFIFFAGFMCALYIPTGLLISRRYRAFSAAQQNPYSAPYGAPAQPQQNYYQPTQPAQSAQPQNPPYPPMPPQARPYDYSDQN